MNQMFLLIVLLAPLLFPDVGGYFETGTLVRYDFLLEVGEARSSLSEANLTREELVFSFSTFSAPSILVYVSSRTQDYMAVVLRHNGWSSSTAS